MDVQLEPWRDADVALLESLNTAEMSRFLGGVEDAADLTARHAEYLGLARDDEGAMFRVVVDGESAGYAGWWAEDHGEPVYEIGCAVGPRWQGRGVATTALGRVVALAAARGDRPVVGYANVANAASNALCRRVGFELRGTGVFPAGDRDDEDVEVNIWVVDPVR